MDNDRRNNSAALAGGPSEPFDDADTISPTTQSPVDPLSQHILKRTSAPGSAGSMRRRSLGASETLGVNQGSESTSAGKSSSELQSSENRPSVPTKEKKWVKTRKTLCDWGSKRLTTLQERCVVLQSPNGKEEEGYYG